MSFRRITPKRSPVSFKADHSYFERNLHIISISINLTKLAIYFYRRKIKYLLEMKLQDF